MRYMKNLRCIITIIACSFLTSAATGKENKDLMRASYYYTHYAYYEAIPYYEKIAEKLNDPAIYASLADCYAATNNTVKAAAAYAKAVDIRGCATPVLLRYAQLLMQMTRYDEAAKWLKEYQKSNKADRRVANMLAACTSAPAKRSAMPPGTTTLLPFNTDGSEFAPTLWKDNLVFASDTAIDLNKKTDNWSGRSYYNIYSLPADSKGHCGTELNKLAETKKINIKYHDGPCTFTADGKQMYYTRSRFNDKFFSRKSIASKDSTVLLEIMIASDYDSASKKFKTVQPFEYNSAEYAVAHPTVSPDGRLLAFSSTKPRGQGGSDIYICKKVRDNWSKPVNAGSTINTEGEEVFPYWANNNTLFFSSDGLEGLGGLDIYKANWNEASGTFDAPQNVGIPLNSSYDDISLAMRPDLGSTYFSSNRPAGKGGDNIFFYRKVQIYLQLNVIDSITRLPVSSASVHISAARQDTTVATSDAGAYFTRLYPEASYNIEITKDPYPIHHLALTATSDRESDTLIRNVSLYIPPPPPVKTIDTVTPLPISFTKITGDPEVDKIYEIGHFYFAFNSSQLNDSAKLVLDSLYSYLVLKPTMRIQVRAHTDCRGGDAYNMKLSNERALAVVDYLTKKGIAPDRLTYIGFGMRQPHVPCPICEKCTDQQRYLNRVLEFKVLQL